MLNLHRYIRFFALILAVFALSACDIYEPTGGSASGGGGNEEVQVSQEGMTFLFSKDGQEVDQVGYENDINIDIVDGDENSVLGSIDHIYLRYPEMGQVETTRDSNGNITSAVLIPKVGGRIDMIAKQGATYLYGSIMGSSNDYLTAQVDRYDLGVGETLQIEIFRHQGTGASNITSVTNFRTVAPDGQLYVENEDNPIADLSMGGLLTGKASGFVHVRASRLIGSSPLTVDIWFCVGSPSVEQAFVRTPFVVAYKGSNLLLPMMVKPDSSYGYSNECWIPLAGVYEDISSSDYSIANPTGNGGEIEVFDTGVNTAQVEVQATIDDINLSWKLLVLHPYEAATNMSGYGLFRLNNKVFLVVDWNLLKHRLNAFWDKEIFAYCAYSGQFHESNVRLQKGYGIWQVPYSVSSGELLELGLSAPINPSDPDTRIYTPDGASDDQTFFGTHWVDNGQGGANLVIQSP